MRSCQPHSSFCSFCVCLLTVRKMCAKVKEGSDKPILCSFINRTEVLVIQRAKLSIDLIFLFFVQSARNSVAML